jgi:hypothetical protein
LIGWNVATHDVSGCQRAPIDSGAREDEDFYRARVQWSG